MSRTSQYDQYDRYDQYDQYDHRSLNRHGTFNEPAVHSSEPHTASRLPAPNEAQDLVLRLSNLSDALFPSTATAHDVPARQPNPRDQQASNPQRGKGTPESRNPRVSETTNLQRGRGTSQSRNPRAPETSNQQRGKSRKSGGKGRGGKESELTVPVKLTVRVHMEEPHTKE